MDDLLVNEVQHNQDNEGDGLREGEDFCGLRCEEPEDCVGEEQCIRKRECGGLVVSEKLGGKLTLKVEHLRNEVDER